MKTCGDKDSKGCIPEGLERHPCFNANAHSVFGRIHLPVSPACNIQCRYCKRGFNKWEASPGVARGLLTPESAARTVDRALKVCPEITVVGIAGPGEPLATDHALQALDLVRERHPGLIMCLSTNGLMLYEKAPEIVKAGVRSLTVTVNAVNAEIQKEICTHIRVGNLHITGEEAARQLIVAQLSGIRRITRLGVFVKINTVLMPGINDRHIGEIASVTAKAGASMINIIPLLPRFDFSSRRVPSLSELEKAQGEAGRVLPVFTHCRRCRADACGIPGSGIDYGNELYGRVEPTFSHG
jgi:nitrogen fixation protein NifB